MSLYPDSPNPASYAAPLIDFSPVGSLPNDFYKGAQQSLDYDKARAFAGGLPRNPDGSLNYTAMMDTMARFGDTSQVGPLSNIDLDRQLINTALGQGGMSLSAPGAPGSSPPAQPSAPQVGTPPSQRVVTPAPASQAQAPEIPPHGVPRVDAKNSVPGGDDGQTSLMSIVASKIGDDAAAGPIALKIAQDLKLDPNATNDPTKAANLAKYVEGYLKRNPATAQANAPEAPAAAATAPAAPLAAPAPTVGAGTAADPLAGILPPGVTRENAPAYLDQLRRRAAALALSPRTAAMAKQYEDQAKAIQDALQPTSGQKEAYASGQMTPLQFDNAKVVAKVTAENSAQTTEQKLYTQAVQQGFKGTELEFTATREAIKGANFKVVGKDANGNDVHGFVDSANRKVYDINGKPIDTSKLAGASDASNAAITGPAFLETLDPGRANQVKAIADGRMAPPGGMSLKSPQIQSLMRDVAQYEPGFDLTTWKARNDTRTDLAKGKMGQNVSSLNTAIGHLETLDKAAEGLNNYSLTPLNTVANIVKSTFGDPAVKQFEIARTAVADELTRAFRGTGGNVHDLQQWESAINAANSPTQLKAAIKQAVELLRSRIEAVGDQYSRGMGKTTDPLQLLSPKARAGLQRLTGEGGEAAPAQPSSAPQPIREGATATNPATGERVVLQGGKWVPLK